MPSSRDYTFQRLGAAEMSLLGALLRVFGEAFGDVESYQGAVPSNAYLAKLLGKDHFIAIVALVGDEVAGGLTAYVRDKPEQERREIYIYDLAVLEAHRRRRVATGLIETLRGVAADLDAYVIFVQADLEDAPAIALYESLGTKETAHHFDIVVRRERKA
jgi:aminoglycoside 3-N-acetyltransferase I